MNFTNSVLTIDGQKLIAQASSANKIVFVQMLSSEIYLDESRLTTATPTDLLGPTGTIKTASATNGVARIIGEFTNLTTSKTVKTVAITARLSTQTDAEAIVMLAQSDPNASVYIPSISEISTSIQIAFNLAIGDASTFAINSAANVSLGDHERLMERSVTTHTDGDDTVGDDQSILGDKTFNGYVSFIGGVLLDSPVQCEGNMAVTGRLEADDIACVSIVESDPTLLRDGIGGMYFLTFEVFNSDSTYGASFHVNRGDAIYQGLTQGTNAISWIQADDMIDSDTSHQYRILKSVSAQINAGTGSNLQVWAIRSR